MRGSLGMSGACWAEPPQHSRVLCEGNNDPRVAEGQE